MLRNVKDLKGYTLRATDGLIGTVDDVYFDDEDWTVRYLIVDTGTWLSGRKVLISPLAIGDPDWLGQWMPVALTTAQVEQSPDIDTRQPVSRQQEAAYFSFYSYPYYWGGAGLWGVGGFPRSLTAEHRIGQASTAAGSADTARTAEDSHLRSCRAVTGYHVHATDGDLGHVEDFLIDERTWAVRYLIVDTSRWWGGHQVLLAPQWISAVSWSESKVSVDLTRRGIKQAPQYDSAAQLDRQQERSIYEHHGRPDYWTTKAAREAETRERRQMERTSDAAPDIHERDAR